MEYILFICILILVLLLYMRLETSFIKSNIFDFSTNPNGLKIAHLSDLHINRLYISNKRIISCLLKINPDIIILSGDYIEKQTDINLFKALLKSLTNVCPVYLSFGNHDHKAFKHNRDGIESFIQIIKETDAIVLHNFNVQINKNNITYNLIGIDDLKYGNPNIEQAFKGINSSGNCHCINIAFSHNPDILLSLPEGKLDYFLCGHFHGGQIWMPFSIEFRLMRHEKLSKMGYKRGLYNINGVKVYINRGLGNVIFPFRFLSPPEIAVIKL